MTLVLALLLAQVEVRPHAIRNDPRSQRPWVLSLEAGWNSLGGVGAVVARHLDPHLTVEAGVGFSGEGPKLGVRVRYNFLVQEATMFLGTGFLYGAGRRERGANYTYTVGASPFLQLVFGIEYQSRRGFNFLGALGYAPLLQPNLTSTGHPPDVEALTGGGPVASASVGYAF